MIATLVALSMAGGSDCRHIASNAYIRYSPVVARPGDLLTLSFEYRDGPFGTKPVPPRCVRKPRVKGSATLERNHTVRITQDAQAASTVRVSVLIGGMERFTDIIITGRDEQVLTGKWSQASAENCYGPRLAELIFTTDGRFSFTFPEMMVETMVSGVGGYSWDQRTGALELGNYRGTARRDGGTLILEGIDIQGVRPPTPPGEETPATGPCRVVLTGG